MFIIAIIAIIAIAAITITSLNEKRDEEFLTTRQNIVNLGNELTEKEINIDLRHFTNEEVKTLLHTAEVYEVKYVAYDNGRKIAFCR